MEPKKKLPIYKMFINDNDETTVNYVALVDSPAIERNWFAFSKQMTFKADPIRKIITGALMIADLPIYRFSPSMGEFYVVFDKKEIEKIAQKFFKQGNTSNVNLMHDEQKIVDGVYMFESFIVDSSRGIKVPDGFTGITEGSWIASYKVENDEVWKQITDGKFQGFSVEGIFDMQIKGMSVEEQIVQVIDEISSMQKGKKK